MKHARKDYQKRIQDNANLIPENEPVFFLRGQDVLAPETIRFWARKLQAAGGDSVLVAQALDQAVKMEEWQKSVKSKLPDGEQLVGPKTHKEPEHNSGPKGWIERGGIKTRR